MAEAGFAPVVAPVLEVRPLVPPPGLEAWLATAAALAFTSPNGVDAFARLTPRRDWPAFAVGDATAEAARAAGFGPVRSADGDIHALARLIDAEWPPGRGPVLNPGPARPAGDLDVLCAAAVQALPVYETVETDAPAPERIDVVLIHSPRGGQAAAARLAPASIPDSTPDLTPDSTLAAVCISEAAAAPLARLGLARITVAARPTEAELLAALTRLGKPARPV